MILSDEDKKWLHKKYPGLVTSPEGISGIIEFTASYNEQINRFSILDKETRDSTAGTCLTGSFKISIQERTDKSISRLPAVRVDGVEPISDRHFGQSDKTACLCSPLEEEEFLTPQFNSQKFLERLVVPFLYGQVFYSAESRWPWSEYAHGSTGLLEAYFIGSDSSKASDCLHKLLLDMKSWPRIKSALTQKSYVKGHTQCFCPKKDHIKRCHPNALKGIQQLRQDIKTHGISVP